MNREERYKIYVTDALKVIIEMYHASRGVTVNLPRYMEEPEASTPEESAEDIINRITERLSHGLTET